MFRFCVLCRRGKGAACSEVTRAFRDSGKTRICFRQPPGPALPAALHSYSFTVVLTASRNEFLRLRPHKERDSTAECSKPARAISQRGGPAGRRPARSPVGRLQEAGPLSLSSLRRRRLKDSCFSKSQIALETAKKDLGSVVATAQRELGHLAGDSSTPSDQAQPSPITEATQHADDEKAPEHTSADSVESSLAKSVDESEPAQPSSPSSSSTTSPFQSLLSSIQSSLPPNISTTLQNNIPQALKDGPRSVDFAHIKNTLATEFQRVQGVTRAQAEEYVHKSEALLKEAGDFLKDAVKIVPPDDYDDTSTGIMWDGADVWEMPTTSARGKGKAKDSELLVKARAAATRAETLLRQLKRDPELLKIDPASIESTKPIFELFVKNDVESMEGGISGTHWTDKRTVCLKDGSIEANTLKETKEALVPSTLDEDTFWTRYFFRVHQIEEDERKRKELLASEFYVKIFSCLLRRSHV